MSENRNLLNKPIGTLLDTFDSKAHKGKPEPELYKKQQKRIDGFEWLGKSRLPGISSDKAAKYYLTAIQTDDAYEEDIYFVNNSDKTLSFVVSEWLDHAEYESIKAGHVLSTVSPSWIYQNVEPYQGVKIASQDIIYDSDGLRQFQVSIFIDSNKVWKTGEVVNGTMGRDCVLLWEGDDFEQGKIISLD